MSNTCHASVDTLPCCLHVHYDCWQLLVLLFELAQPVLIAAGLLTEVHQRGLSGGY